MILAGICVLGLPEHPQTAEPGPETRSLSLLGSRMRWMGYLWVMGAAGAKGGAWQRYGTFGTEILKIVRISACSCHAAPRPTTPPTTPGDPIHLILDPNRPGELVFGVSLVVGARLGVPRARFLRIN